MADDFVGGGYGWMQQFLDALYNAAQQTYQRDIARGYIREGYEEARPAPTEQQALDAIWANRPDLKEFYDANWGKGKYEPADAVRNWLGMSPEAGGMGAVDYALQQGWVQPGSEGAEGTDVPTLERETWEKEYLRQLGLDEEAIRQFNEQMQFQREQATEETRRWSEEFGRQVGLDEEAIRQWQAEFERQTGLDAEDTRRWNETFLRQQGLDEEAIRQWQATFDYQREQDTLNQANYQREFLRQQGLDEEAVRQWEAEHALSEQELGLRGELGRGELGLGYLSLLGSLRGPQDWMQYWNVQRNAANTQLPAWASALMGNVQQTPAFQGAAPGGVAPASEGIQLQPTGDAAQQNIAGMGGLFAQGHQVTPAQWATLAPSEQAGLQSVIEYQGGYMPDWIKNMMAAAPKIGQGAGGSYFQGW